MSKCAVIIGGGAGGASVAAEAKRIDPSLSVTIIEGSQYVSAASRPTPYYIGDLTKDEKRLIARTPEKFRETEIVVRLNTVAEGVDVDKKGVRLSDGTTVPYDILVLGAGAYAFIPKIPGTELEGVFTLKTLNDAI